MMASELIVKLAGMIAAWGDKEVVIDAGHRLEHGYWKSDYMVEPDGVFCAGYEGGSIRIPSRRPTESGGEGNANV